MGKQQYWKAYVASVATKQWVINADHDNKATFEDDVEKAYQLILTTHKVKIMQDGKNVIALWHKHGTNLEFCCLQLFSFYGKSRTSTVASRWNMIKRWNRPVNWINMLKIKCYTVGLIKYYIFIVLFANSLDYWSTVTGYNT